MQKILISGCFLGQKVRYDGGHNDLTHALIRQWSAEGRLISICPEVVAGLSIPRPPAEIQQHNGERIVITNLGNNVTEAFQRGAEQALVLCQRHNISYALLKESSPSCGSSTVYDGYFSKTKIIGEGITTALLREHGIQVFSEKNINELVALFELN